MKGVCGDRAHQLLEKEGRASDGRERMGKPSLCAVVAFVGEKMRWGSRKANLATAGEKDNVI